MVKPSFTVKTIDCINCMHQTRPTGRKLERLGVTHMLHNYHVRNGDSRYVKNGSYSSSNLE